MREPLRPWQTDESLTELTLHADWDSMAAMIQSLRLHLFEHGTVPTWNFMLCGGLPELAVPHSWAYTWPSLIAYVLAPNHAIVALWCGTTLLGLLATRALLLRWFGDATGAWVGAAVYALSGFFAARFNAGHVPFAFFHLVPWLMLLFEWGYERARAGRPLAGICAATLLGSFLFASAGIPHALLHLYPAFLLLVLVRVASGFRREGVGALRAAVAPALANGLGVWLAAYKLVPVVAWQLDAPRAHVRPEAYGLLDVLGNTLRFVPDYFQIGKQRDWHVFSSWEYNAFVGPLPWLLALVAVVGWLRRRGDRPGGETVGFALLVIAAGVLLALGNDHRASPAYAFAHLPPLDGVRAFARYQVLVVFGLGVLTAGGIATLARSLSPRLRRPLLAVVAVGAVAPVVAQSGFLVWNVAAERNAEILQGYGGPGGEPPQLALAHRRRIHESRHETSLLAGGYWVENCKSDVALPSERSAKLRFLPLSTPPPEAIERIGRRELVLRYPSDVTGRVVLNLRSHDGARLDVPSLLVRERMVFQASSLPDRRVTFTSDYPGPGRGAAFSLAGVLASAGFLAALRRRDGTK